MTISYRNITLSEIELEDIELLRNLRNENRDSLLNQTRIDKDEQLLWFKALDKEKNVFFKIMRKEVLVGFIFVKNIDAIQNSFETGVLILEEFKGSSAVSFSAIMLSFYFFYYKNFDYAFAYIHKENQDAIAFNKSLRFEILEQVEDFYKLCCSKEAYLSLLEKYHLTNKLKNEIKLVLS